MDANWSPAERQQLEQELLELHFGCHPDPEALQARLQREPALRELQQRVLATATLLQRAAAPPQAPLRLPQPARHIAFWRSPRRRMLTAAAAAAAVVATVGAIHGARAWQLASLRHEQCRVTVSAPRAVPVGAPWSFTVESEDLDGAPVHAELTWRALAADGSVLANGTGATAGRSAVAMTAGLTVPQRLEVTARAAGESVMQQLSFESTTATPLVHVTTDKPVYRPGEPVFVRAVVLDRCTLLASPQAQTAVVTIKDAKGGLVFQQGGVAIDAGGTSSGVAACVWQVPPESAGGEHTVEVSGWDGTFPAEQQTFVVRAFRAPRLQKEITLDRKTYAPGERGSAEVAVARLGAGAAQGASVRGSLVLDGDEVWQQEGTLDAHGKATFRFTVPQAVRQGAARFVASVTDGGVVETEMKPFVVPTGDVLASAYPEGGELIAGVENRLYVELQRHGTPAERRSESALIDLAYAKSMPLVATNEPYFATVQDYEAHDALICIAEGRLLAESDRRQLTSEHRFKSRAEMAESNLRALLATARTSPTAPRQDAPVGDAEMAAILGVLRGDEEEDGSDPMAAPVAEQPPTAAG